MLTFSLVFLAACRSSEPSLEVCDTSSASATGATTDTSVKDTGDTGADTSDTSDTNAYVAPTRNVCPAWAGIPDTMATSGVFESTPDEAGVIRRIHTMAWWNFEGRDPVPSVGTMLFSESEVHPEGTVQLGATITGTLSFHCDDAGLWLHDESHQHRVIDSLFDGELEYGGWTNEVDSNDTPLLLIPKDLELGMTWTSRWSGGTLHYNDPTLLTGDLTLTVTELRDYATPAGTWQAARITMSPTDDVDSDPALMIQISSTLFHNPDGFWVGKGIGLLQFDDVVRTQAD